MFLRKYKTVIFVVALLAIALILLSYNLKHETGTGLVKKIVMEAASPVHNILLIAVKNVSDAWLRYIFLVGLEQNNRDLKKYINELKAELILYREGYLESQRLKKLLSLRDNYDYHFISARVIGREPAGLSRTIMINKGSAHGLKTGMPVIAPPGLVGRLTEVSWHVSKVLLFIDESSNIDVILQKTRTQGIVRGAGSRGCILKYISKNIDVKENEVVVSSGIGGVFPKGLLVGTINSVDKQADGLFLKININPFVDFSKLEEVLVLSADEEESQ
jgi:rod shape-determining protein MreC